jgi:HSP20 family protein
MDAVTVTSRRVKTILDELDAMQRRVATRAFELFQGRGSGGHELDDWLAAEQEETWTPPIDLREVDRQFVLKAAIAGVEPNQVDVRVTRDDVLIEADVHHEHARPKEKVVVCEFAHGKLFRRIHFPQHVNPDKVEATLKHGLLTVTAPIVEPSQAVEITPS